MNSIVQTQENILLFILVIKPLEYMTFSREKNGSFHYFHLIFSQLQLRYNRNNCELRQIVTKLKYQFERSMIISITTSKVKIF